MFYSIITKLFITFQGDYFVIKQMHLIQQSYVQF